ncbi:hypothetical protein ABW19_dt0210106 [Dactylella cylindrospora]|nr:hypothetical protein ABW19_dt0210106 [Dactylella cylindrospora]
MDQGKSAASSLDPREYDFDESFYERISEAEITPDANKDYYAILGIDQNDELVGKSRICYFHRIKTQNLLVIVENPDHHPPEVVQNAYTTLADLEEAVTVLANKDDKIAEKWWRRRQELLGKSSEETEIGRDYSPTDPPPGKSGDLPPELLDVGISPSAPASSGLFSRLWDSATRGLKPRPRRQSRVLIPGQLVIKGGKLILNPDASDIPEAAKKISKTIEETRATGTTTSGTDPEKRERPSHAIRVSPEHRDDAGAAAEDSIGSQVRWDNRYRAKKRRQHIEHIRKYMGGGKGFPPRQPEFWETDPEGYTKMFAKRPELHWLARARLRNAFLEADIQAADEEEKISIVQDKMRPYLGSEPLTWGLDLEHEHSLELPPKREVAFLNFLRENGEENPDLNDFPSAKEWMTADNRRLIRHEKRTADCPSTAAEMQEEIRANGGIDPGAEQLTKWLGSNHRTPESYKRSWFWEFVLGPDEREFTKKNPELPKRYRFEPGEYKIGPDGEMIHVCRRGESFFEHMYFSCPTFKWPEHIPKPPGESAYDRHIREVRREQARQRRAESKTGAGEHAAGQDPLPPQIS